MTNDPLEDESAGGVWKWCKSDTPRGDWLIFSVVRMQVEGTDATTSPTSMFIFAKAVMPEVGVCRKDSFENEAPRDWRCDRRLSVLDSVVGRGLLKDDITI